MEYHTGMQSETRPKEVLRGHTGTWFHYNIVEKQGEREETHEVYTYYEYDGFWFPESEYEGVQEGRLPNNAQGWNDTLWGIFLKHQHSLTDTLYLDAQRHLRNSEAGWTEYVTSLDSWNNEIDNRTMGDTHSTPIPVEPGKV